MEFSLTNYLQHVGSNVCYHTVKPTTSHNTTWTD